MSQENPKNLLIDILKQHPEGLTISSIAEKSGLHRHTSRKYINELIGAGNVAQRCVGAAKLCYLNSDSSEPRTQKRSFFSRFNFKIMLLVIFISFLLSEAAILAYENDSFNETHSNNISNSSPITASMILNESNMSRVIETAIENASNGSVDSDSLNIDTFTNISAGSSTNETDYSVSIDNESVANETQNITSETNETQVIPEENQNTDEITGVSNDTGSFSNESVNISLPIMNENARPEFVTNLDFPQRITRGEMFTVKVYVTNVGSLAAKNVAASLTLPEGFNLVSSNSDCSILEPAESCISEITVSTATSTSLGLADLKVVINHEE
ncbi:MAG: NEW3 domain-containing protein [Candidatus Bathyarchaeota archaeon]